MNDTIKKWYEEHKLENKEIEEKFDELYNYNSIQEVPEAEPVVSVISHYSNVLEERRASIINLIENIDSIEKGKYVFIDNKVFMSSAKNRKIKLQNKRKLLKLISNFTQDEKEIESLLDEVILFYRDEITKGRTLLLN